MKMMTVRLLTFLAASMLLSSCAEDQGETSFSLQSSLEGMEITCDELSSWDFTQGFLTKSELGGWGVLIISRNNKPNTFDLSLVSHGHERAFENRRILCE
jgi:hypothetical protein